MPKINEKFKMLNKRTPGSAYFKPLSSVVIAWVSLVNRSLLPCVMVLCAGIHLLFKAKHAVKFIFSVIVVLLTSLRIVRIRMEAVEKFHGMKTAFVDVEVNIPLFKVWGI